MANTSGRAISIARAEQDVQKGKRKRFLQHGVVKTAFFFLFVTHPELKVKLKSKFSLSRFRLFPINSLGFRKKLTNLYTPVQIFQ
jgi:hypothetical protein